MRQIDLVINQISSLPFDAYPAEPIVGKRVPLFPNKNTADPFMKNLKNLFTEKKRGGSSNVGSAFKNKQRCHTFLLFRPEHDLHLLSVPILYEWSSWVSPRQVLKSLRGPVTEKFENFSPERMSLEGHFCQFSRISVNSASRYDFSKLRPVLTFSTWQQRIGLSKFSSYFLI
jgi:hypothetical protein